MQQTSLKDRNDTVDKTATVRTNAGHALNVALVYQEAPGRQRAGHALDQLAELVGRESIHGTEWKVGDLMEAKVFSEGVAALSKADVIVIALSEAERLPSAFYRWVNVWLQQRCGIPGALIASVVPPAGLSSETNETRSYLCAVASQGRLQFVTQEHQTGEPIRGLIKDIQTLSNKLKRLNAAVVCDFAAAFGLNGASSART